MSYSSYPTIARCLLETLPKTLCDQYHKRLDNNSEFEGLDLDSDTANALLHVDEYIKVVIEDIPKFSNTSSHQADYKKLEQCFLISFIMASLEMEGTWPGEASTNYINQMLQIRIDQGEHSILETPSFFPYGCYWHAEGKENDFNQTGMQLSAHLLAYWHLCRPLNLASDAILTVQLLNETHARLLKSAYSSRNNQFGKLRTTSVISFTSCVNEPPHIFPPSELVPQLLQGAVDRYNSRRLNRTGVIASPLALACSLFYEVVDIHPFENGNGRLARLLFAYSLMRDGFPFPVPLQCSTDAARTFCLEAIERVRFNRVGHPIGVPAPSLKLSCESYRPESLDHLVQLGLYSMFSMTSNLETLMNMHLDDKDQSKVLSLSYCYMSNASMNSQASVVYVKISNISIYSC